MRKIISKIMLVTMLVVSIIPLTAKAGFQANKGGTTYKIGSNNICANNLFIGAREMETKGGTLGKEATLAETTYLDLTEGGNGIDCHMAKNTEWGTAAMLAASDYGEAPSGQSSESTTQNESGIYQMADGSSENGCESVAGIWKEGGSYEQYISTIRNADSRYYDLYESQTSKPGDATTETKDWKGSSNAVFISEKCSIFCRDYRYGLFDWISCNGYYIGALGGRVDPGTRAVAVCGQGL